MTFDECVSEWCAMRVELGEIPEWTARKNRYEAKRLSPEIGDMDINDITPLDVSRAMMRAKHVRRDGKPGDLSPASMRKTHLTGHMALEWAGAMGLMDGQNPFDKVKRPRADRGTRRALSADEASRLFLEARRDLDGAMAAGKPRKTTVPAAVVIALETGMRLGEIVSLKWADVDLDGCAVKVVASRKPDGADGKPKTEAGIRSISIDDGAALLLGGLLDWQRACFGRDPVYVLSADQDGCPYATLTHQWASWRERHGFGKLKFHELRHTHASMLVNSGVDVKTAQVRLGHASASITLDVYTHFTPANDVAASAEVGKILAGIGTNEARKETGE